MVIGSVRFGSSSGSQLSVQFRLSCGDKNNGWKRFRVVRTVSNRFEPLNFEYIFRIVLTIRAAFAVTSSFLSFVQSTFIFK